MSLAVAAVLRKMESPASYQMHQRMENANKALLWMGRQTNNVWWHSSNHRYQYRVDILTSDITILLIIADLLKAVSDISNSNILCLFYDGSLEPFSMADSTNCFSENFCFCSCSKTIPRDNKLGFVIGNSQYFWHNTALRFVNKKCLFLLRYYKNVTTPTNNSVEWVKLMIFRHDTKYIDTVNDQFLSSSKIERWQYWQVLIIVIKQATT